MAQQKTIAVSDVDTLTIDDDAAGWPISEFMDCQVGFSNLSGITVSVTLYPVIGGGSVAAVPASDITAASPAGWYPYETFGPQNKIVLDFDSAFSGVVVFGSARPFVANNV